MISNLPSWSDFGTHDESRFPELWEGCVGAWAPCLGPTGLRLHDHSRFGNWGTLTNMDAPTDWLVSGGAYCLDFDGTNDKVSGIGTTSSFSFIHTTANFSISFWAKFDTDSTRLNVTGNTLTGSEKGFTCLRESLAGYGTNVMRCIVFGAGDATYAVTGSTADNTALAGSWNHWSYTSNYSNTIGQWYRNGIAITTTSRFNPGDSSVGGLGTGDSSRTLSIGLSTFSSDILLFDGQLDDLFVHRRALSPSEVQTLARGRGIAFERRRRRSAFFNAEFFNAAWARNSNYILSPVGAA